MCGRFVSSTPPDQLAKYFGADLGVAELAEEPSADFNVAPTKAVLTVYESSGTRHLERFHWGLVPFWARDPKIGNRMINARAETLAEKNAYKRSYAKRRCIVPVDGFYEWQTIEGRKIKQPVFISRVDGEPLAFAGLWASWTDESHLDDHGEPMELLSCTIITGDANETIAPVHDRMPVVLPPDAWDAWLDRDNHDIRSLDQLLVPAPEGLLQLRPVSTEVNNVRNNGPHLMDEIDPDAG